MKVRFAPSPTGVLHIGGARTALYNWLAARGAGGTFVLRIEDTDRERSTPENVEVILDSLRWLELDWDEGPVSQAERAERHRQAVERLLEAGKAYHDPATGEDVQAWKLEHGSGRGYRGPQGLAQGAIRLRVPDEGQTVAEDVIRGPVSFPNESMDDFVIARADGTPLYNLAVAVDDAEMAITDVIRGDDHLSNTPKQLLVLEALGQEAPRYAHLPLLHGPDGKKLSKRHGAASVTELRDRGFLPEAVRNYLALLGWGTTDDTTLMSTEELIDRFDLDRVGKASSIFDEKKLRWINGRFMRELPADQYADRVAVHSGHDRSELFDRACRFAQEKAQTLDEVWPLIRYAFDGPADDAKAWSKVMDEQAAGHLADVRAALDPVEQWDVEPIGEALERLLAETGAKAGKVFQPVRVALTGSTVSPGIFETLALLPKPEAMARIDTALARLKAQASTADQ